LPRTNGRSLSTQKIIDHLKLDGEKNDWSKKRSGLCETLCQVNC
jgi:hypothetical protein